MKKLIRWTAMALLLAALFHVGRLMADKTQLQNNLIRLHVVANSDSQEDQAQKLLVRDAIVEALRDGLKDVTDIQKARAYVQEKLPELERIANQVLREAGAAVKAKISLAMERFGVRDYDTFTLPSGVYESLRVTIGEGAGKNWWCVVFPALCLPATAEDFQNTAVSSGFSRELTDTLAHREDYEVRFFFLDCLGKIENFFFGK